MKLNKFRFGKVSWKLTLIYAGIFFLVLTLLNAAIIFGVHYFLVHQATEQVKDTGDIIIDQFNESAQKSTDLEDKDLVLGIPSNDNIYVKIVDKHGKIINESARFNLKIPDRIPLKTNKISIVQQKFLYQNRIMRVDQKPYAYLQVVKSLANETQFLEVLIFLMLGADLAGIFISILSGYVVSREMLKPLSHITATAQSISIHDLTQRIQTSGPQDELTELGMTFNKMIDRLQKSFEQQNQFVSDASHELRTPISVIQGYINLLDRWGKEEKAVLQESITVIKNEVANMAELTEKLLFLARGDSNAYNLCWESFCLNELVEEVFKETKLIASQHQVLLQRNQKMIFNGDYKLLKQMLRAVLDNCIKFTPSGGEIAMDSSLVNDMVKLVIKDTGVGIPETEIPYIFNRFYQVEKARFKNQSGFQRGFQGGFTDGSGLGLAIVKWIVNVHQGNIEVESDVTGGGTRICIVLPLNKSEKAQMKSQISF